MCFIIAVYVNVPTSRDGVPMISAFPFAVIGGVMFLDRTLSQEAIGAVLLALGVFVCSLMATDFWTYLDVRALAFGQYIYSTLIGLTLYWTVKSFSAKEVARFSEVAIIIMLCGAVLEITTPLSSAIDSVMNPLFGLDKYADIIRNRDLSIGFGLRRPKFFSSETSYFAMALCFLICTYAYLSPQKGATIRAGVYAVLGLLVARSPILIFASVFIGLGQFLGGGGSGRRTNVDRMALGLVIAVPMLLGGYFLLTELFEARLAQVTSGADYSSIYRTYGSWYAALAVLSEYPFFGVGIGSINAAYRPLTQTYLSLGIPAFSVMYEWRFQVQNLLAALMIYLGSLGTIFYLGYLYFYTRTIVGQIGWQSWALFLILSATASAFYSPRYITYYFLILSITKIANLDRAVAEGGTSRVFANLKV